MKPSKLESRRVEISSEVDTVEVTLTGNHISSPIISLSLQPFVVAPGEDSGEFRTTCRVIEVLTNKVKVEFSSLFKGYLHLHAVSEL